LDYSKDFNIIAINLDGLRRDKLHRCPTLKALSEQSYYFSQMSTVSPYTFASLHAIFSGLYPSSNGVNAYYNMFKFKKNSLTTIPQFLKKLGYYTCCDINSESIMPKQGYDEYLIYDEKTIDFPQRHSDLIKKLHKKKFFIFLQNTETHNNLVRAIIERDKEKSSDNEYFNTVEENDLVYNSHLPATDSYVDILLNTLDELGISKKTILVIFSDHGTSVGEKKGEKFYGVYVYDYTLNVFTIIHIPGQAPKKIDKQCRTIDIFPTIAEITGAQIEQSSKIQGESLFSFIENPNAEDREVFVETGGLYGPWPSPKKHNVFCVRKNNKKLIYNKTPKTWEFYDLESDPKELNNIYDEESQLEQSYKEILYRYLKDNSIH